MLGDSLLQGASKALDGVVKNPLETFAIGVGTLLDPSATDEALMPAAWKVAGFGTDLGGKREGVHLIEFMHGPRRLAGG